MDYSYYELSWENICPGGECEFTMDDYGILLVMMEMANVYKTLIQATELVDFIKIYMSLVIMMVLLTMTILDISINSKWQCGMLIELLRVQYAMMVFVPVARQP